MTEHATNAPGGDEWPQDDSRFFAPPWCIGQISREDARFITQLVVELDPEVVIEIGVASGYSSAVFLRALAQHAKKSERPRLWSWDLLTTCYFDSSRAVGAAALELVPELAKDWILRQGIAADAGDELLGADASLAFIDAHHSVPWPTLDLLALLPALASNAWVALHDIELPNKPKFQHVAVHGALQLYQNWPWRKRTPTPGSNIGAIQLPGSHSTVRDFATELLRQPWEVAIEADLLDRLEIPMRSRGGGDCLGTEELAALRALDRPIIVWGAGAAGRQCLAALRQAELAPQAIADADPLKEGTELEGVTIISPETAASRCTTERPFFLIASMHAREIAQTLRALGLSQSGDFARYRYDPEPGS